MKILYQARLVDIRKVGRFYHYRARRAELDERIPGLQQWLTDRPLATQQAQPSPRE
jgi:hypothetical protein